ncbi:MAG: cytidylate kinase-like family protein [Lachnospiraceae bacterium]|nr:cytidylate kinase-like family protein [Lachnospiraceae bacterium]
MNRIITIGREFGSGGREMGVRLANELGFQYYDKEIITGIVNHTDYTESYVKEIIEGNTRRIIPVTIGRSLDVDVEYQIQQMQDIVKAQTEVIKEMAEKSDCVIVGRCADYILEEDDANGKIQLFKLFVHASMESRVKRCMERRSEDEMNMTEKDMEKQLTIIQITLSVNGEQKKTTISALIRPIWKLRLWFHISQDSSKFIISFIK